jgi:aspartate/methionine/tyrosine aminotransferase
MPDTHRVMKSDYMHWAKTHVHARWYVGASGVANYPLSSLPVNIEDLEITGDSYYGYAPLQDAIARHTGVSADRVFSALGTSQANHLAMAALVRPGDEVLIEQPAYELMVSTALYLGATVTRFERKAADRFAVDPDEVGRRITPRTRLVVVTNLHNPTSAIVDEATLLAVAKVCRRAGAKVLVDEVYLESAFGMGTRTAALLGDDFVVTNSLTKVYGLSGLRCGWVLAEPGLVTAMWRLKDLFESIPPHVSERLSVIAFRHLDTIRERSKSMIDENRRTLRETLLRRGEIDCFDPGYGTVVFPRLARGSVDALADRLAGRYETLITPGAFFDLPEHFRVGLGGKPEMFREGMRRLCAGLDDLAAG